MRRLIIQLSLIAFEFLCHAVCNRCHSGELALALARLEVENAKAEAVKAAEDAKDTIDNLLNTKVCKCLNNNANRAGCYCVQSGSACKCSGSSQHPNSVPPKVPPDVQLAGPVVRLRDGGTTRGQVTSQLRKKLSGIRSPDNTAEWKDGSSSVVYVNGISYWVDENEQGYRCYGVPSEGFSYMGLKYVDGRMWPMVRTSYPEAIIPILPQEEPPRWTVIRNYCPNCVRWGDD